MRSCSINRSILQTPTWWQRFRGKDLPNTLELPRQYQFQAMFFKDRACLNLRAFCKFVSPIPVFHGNSGYAGTASGEYYWFFGFQNVKSVLNPIRLPVWLRFHKSCLHELMPCLKAIVPKKEVAKHAASDDQGPLMVTFRSEYCTSHFCLNSSHFSSQLKCNRWWIHTLCLRQRCFLSFLDLFHKGHSGIISGDSCE